MVEPNRVTSRYKSIIGRTQSCNKKVQTGSNSDDDNDDKNGWNQDFEHRDSFKQSRDQVKMIIIDVVVSSQKILIRLFEHDKHRYTL